MDMVFKWINLVVEGENFESYTTFQTEGFQSSQGHLSDMTFVTINGVSNDNTRKTFNLVFKYGKEDKKSRENLPVKMALEAEMLMYEKVLPEFEKLQLQNETAWRLGCYVRCYKCLKLPDMEVLVLQNMKSGGYETHNKKRTFNIGHCKAVLREYAKLHALSFALKDQQNETFQSLAGETKNVIVDLIKTDEVKNGINRNISQALDTLNIRGDRELSEAFGKMVGEDGAKKFFEILLEKEEQAVFIHGDCWNDNFLFKYEDTSKTIPADLKVIDWQQSTLSSPALDIAFFLYDVGSRQEFEQFDEFLVYYYSCFSTFLTSLGSDPMNLFTFEDLQQHWIKYSLAAIIDFLTLIKYITGDNGSNGQEFGNVEIADFDSYYVRIKDVITHFVEYTAR